MEPNEINRVEPLEYYHALDSDELEEIGNDYTEIVYNEFLDSFFEKTFASNAYANYMQMKDLMSEEGQDCLARWFTFFISTGYFPDDIFFDLIWGEESVKMKPIRIVTDFEGIVSTIIMSSLFGWITTHNNTYLMYAHFFRRVFIHTLCGELETNSTIDPLSEDIIKQESVNKSL